MSVFRRPAPDRPVGDAIPFSHDGDHHLFFLSAPSDDSSWLHWHTRDFVTWTELPVAIAPDEVEGAAWTGSVVERDGVFHLFYTGSLAGSDTPQTICRATSADLVTFVRDVERNPILLPDATVYEPGDWRDPYVFFNADEGLYWMVIAARRNRGPHWRRGCLALATSPDLSTWTLEPEPLYEPGNTFCPECPEVFQLGSTWYLVYSRFSENAATVYRVANSPRGPWRTPPHDALEGRRWYAAKSMPVGADRRMFFGWIADRDGDTDGGAWRWGGDFALPRQVEEAASGRLAMHVPPGALTSFTDVLPAPATVALGAPGRTEHTFLEVDERALDAGYVLDCRLRPASDSAGFGVLIRTDDDLAGYAVTFDRGRGTVALAAWPQPASPPWSESMGHAQVVEPDGPRLVEMPLPGLADTVHVVVVVEGSLLEVFVDDVTALSYRIYARGQHELGFYADDGRLDVEDIDVRRKPDR
jgi:beta-fructofuranosidase